MTLLIAIAAIGAAIVGASLRRMTAVAALILYPSWAIAGVLAATAARLGRATGAGLIALCGLLVMWLGCVVLVELPATRGVAEHVVAFGMLQAGGYVHAGLDVTRAPQRWPAWLGYAWGAAVGALGLAWPRGLYGPDLVDAGPAFWPIAVASGIGALVVAGWMVREARRREGGARRQMAMLAAGNMLAIASGGGALLLRIVGLVHDLRYTAPVSLLGTLVIGAAVVRGEVGASRRLIVQTLAYAALAAAITAIGVAALFVALPILAPGPAIGWTAFVVFTAALPLDALRTLIVDAVGRRVFVAPIGVRDLADEVTRHEARADHAARLAELGALVGAVAHEVRNPLGVISAHVKVLERAGAPAASLDAVRAQVRRASRFVDDLLAYGRPRPLALAEHAARAVIDEAVAAVRAVHPQVRVQDDAGDGVALAIDAPAALHVVADRAALVDVLVNLIGNAVIAVGERGRVAIAASVRDDALELAITDDGPGVPAELRDRLFQPFVTGRGRDHAHPGTGLGLATARSIVERHGGALTYAPAEPGARFVIRLPRG